MATEAFPEARPFREEGSRDLWRRYCGFLDLSMEEFMEVQNYLLMDQVQRMAPTPLGRAIMRGRIPSSMEEFRRVVPITSYEDYAPYIGQCQENALAEKPYFWCHSAGRGGYFKWIPYTRAAFDRVARYGVAVGILAAAERKGEVDLVPEARVLVNLAPRPYASGSLLHHFAEYFPYRPIPPLSQAEEMDFRQRTALAFRLALERGMDYIFSTSTVLVKIGEAFASEERGLKLSRDLLRPSVLSRVLLGWSRSRLGRRPLMPRDLWSPKGLVTFGVDTSVYEDEIARMWGKRPYQVYGTTEMMVGAVQGWNKRALTFLPNLAFWEFIPHGQWQRSHEGAAHQPNTVLLSELRPGQQYEVVLSHFYGMPLMRYRIGDVIEVVALSDPETGVALPQVAFRARASEIIDLAGLTQLDERTLWSALFNTGLRYEEWCACKEYRDGVGYLRLFLELKEERTAQEVEALLEGALRAVDVDYRDLEAWLGQQRAVAVSLLAPGTFSRYYEEKVSEGGSLAQLRPPHISPPASVIRRLVQLSNGVASHEPAE